MKLFRYEIPVSKLSMILQRLLIIGSGGIYSGCERSYDQHSTFNLNSGYPRGILVSRPTIRNAFESGFIVFSNSLIHALLGRCRWAKITSSAVQTVSVNVIGLKSFFALQYKRMKKYEISVLASDRVRGCIPGSLILDSEPFIRANCVGVDIVNYCRLALTQWNYNHRPIVS